VPELTEAERSLILDLTADRIALADFLATFGRKDVREPRFLLHTLERIVSAKDRESAPYLFYLWGYLAEEVTEAHRHLLRRMLSEHWHDQHEWIVDSMQATGDALGVPALRAAAQTRYPTLDECDEASLRARCVHAVARIGGADAERALQELAREDGEVGALAARLLAEAEDTRLIATRWTSRQIALADGIMFASGALFVARSFTVAADDTVRSGVQIIAGSALRSLLRFNANPWFEIEALHSCISDDGTLCAIAGGAEMGNQGFVALTTRSGALRWVAAFVASNPFDEVRFVGQADGLCVVARNTYEQSWCFPFASPETVSIRE